MLLSTFLIAIIAFSSGVASRSEQPLSDSTIMSVEPSPTYTLLGSTLTVNITVANVSDFAGWEFELYWLNKKLNGTSVAEGPFLKQAGSTYFSITNFTDNYNSTCGIAWVSAVLLGPGPGVYGTGTIASISFKAKNGGSTGLWFGYTKLVDSAANTIPHVAVSGIAYVTFHCVSVTNVTTSKTIVGQGYGASVNITVENQGNYTETFNATAYANTKAVKTKTVTLTIGNSTTITFTWNTTGFAYGNYTISANIMLTPGETNNGTGKFTYGAVKVTIPGDVNGDGVVNAKDLGILATYWLETVPPVPANVDIGGYGVISGKDLGIVATYWLQSWT
jgi:hypothetical protein